MSKLMLLTLALAIRFGCAAQAPPELAAADFAAKTKAAGAQLLDVRTRSEYESGHLENALWADWKDSAEFRRRTSALDKSKPLYVYCLSGGRSGAAAQWLAQQGFTQVESLQGGILAWKKANLPVAEDAAVPQLSLDGYRAKIPSTGTTLVDFGAPWCPPCAKMNPVVDHFEKTQGTKLTVVRIDAGAQTNLAKALGIRSLPTFVVYKNGKETARKTGLLSEADLGAMTR